jgi:hypothetical protein
MTAALLAKWVLALVFIPLVFVSLRMAQRYLAIDHPVRKLLAQHGVVKVACYSLFAFCAIGGILLTVIYS